MMANKFRPKPLAEQVLVITGASSGIGLATAKAAAAQGARLVLTSRNAEALEEIVREIGERGGQAIHVVADVGRREELQRVADAALERFGQFDTWVNNAGHSVWGRLEQVSDDDHRRLFDTNFWGVVYGSTIAAAHLKQHGGVIINLGSVASDYALPIQGMYSASKHAVKGFTDALRMELEQAGDPVWVTLIKPTSINTPFPQHAKNYGQQAARLPPPVYSPDEVAHAILHAATHRERDVYVGSAARLFSTLNRMVPRVMDLFGEHVLARFEYGREPERHRDDSFHQPGQDGRVDGDHPGHVRERSYYTRASLHPVMTGALVAAAGVAAATMLGAASSRRRA